MNGTWNIPVGWLLPNASYQWRSTAYDPYGFSTSSSWMNFTVNRSPGTPDLRTTLDGALRPAPVTLGATSTIPTLPH
jgi:hypothetical protein